MTVTHPQHPLTGQRVEVIRVRRGVEPSLVVRSPDGLHVALAFGWTDYPTPGAPVPSPTAPHLLSVDGLRHLAQLIAQFQHEEQGPAARRALGWDERPGTTDRQSSL